jgi:prepilin-type N-terminal cleavage/methylation domain-containing protein
LIFTKYISPKTKHSGRHCHGFTLIELVVVIAILGILAGIAIPRFLDSQATAKGAKIVADLRTIDSAATIYYAKNSKFPTAITGNNPPTTDGFVGTYLAAWPEPRTGTFIVPQLKGGSKTFEGITADYYTLNTNGRALYNGHPVEWYLNGGDTDFMDNNLIYAINTITTYLSQKNLNWYQSNGSTLNNLLTGVTVDSSVTDAAGYTGPQLYWHTETGADYYYATTYNNSGNSGAQWVATLVEVNGVVYSIKNPSQVTGYSANGSGPASDRMQAGLEAMVKAGTAKRLGTITTN